MSEETGEKTASYVASGQKVNEESKESPNKALFQNLAEQTQDLQKSLNYSSSLDEKADDPNDVDSVAHAKMEAEKLNAQMNEGIAEAEVKKAMADRDVELAKQRFEKEGKVDLEHLKKTQDSIQRLHTVLSGKASMERMAELARKLKVDLTPEIQALGDNDAISNALVDRAIKLGRNIKDIDKELLSFPAEDDGPPPSNLLLDLH